MKPDPAEIPGLIHELFEFLQTDYDCTIIRSDASNMGVVMVYQNRHAKAGIGIDYRDDELYVDLVVGHDSQYPSDRHYRKTIFPLLDLVLKHHPAYEKERLRSRDRQYEEPLRENAARLKQYADRFMNGEETLP